MFICYLPRFVQRKDMEMKLQYNITKLYQTKELARILNYMLINYCRVYNFVIVTHFKHNLSPRRRLIYLYIILQMKTYSMLKKNNILLFTYFRHQSNVRSTFLLILSHVYFQHGIIWNMSYLFKFTYRLPSNICLKDH